MSDADRIWDELDDVYRKWGLSEIPFSESATVLREDQLGEVFTGREEELRDVLHLFKSTERKRILVYGSVGIGKSAFMLEVLGVLRRKLKKALISYISLPAGTDLATAALIALAREMDDDDWAQQQLHQMGLPTQSAVHKKKEKLNAGFKGGVPGLVEFGTGGDREIETLPINKVLVPTLAFEDLLKRAQKRHERVIIAIDDLDKQDPAKVRQLLHDAQGMLKGEAWFLLSGHPHGLTRDLLTTERGLFDLAVRLEQLDQATMHRMLVNYLNSVRAKNARREPDDPRAVLPFTPEAARALCERSQGVPRWLNRLGSYVLLKAAKLRAEKIDEEVLQEGVAYANQQVRGQVGERLTDEELYILELVLNRGSLSDTSISIQDLEKIRAQEFSEILPILNRLVEKDLLQRLPSDLTAEYRPTPLLLRGKEEPEV